MVVVILKIEASISLEVQLTVLGVFEVNFFLLIDQPDFLEGVANG